jgi:hypothetical protein
MDIASASRTEDPGSNPASVKGFYRENIAMLMCKIDLLYTVCVWKNRNKGIGPKIF